MQIEKLYLFNFRNFIKFESGFDWTNIILGPNASGKTNLIESIYLLSTGRSFRARQRKELINFDRDFCKVIGRIKNKDKKGKSEKEEKQEEIDNAFYKLAQILLGC